MKQTSLFNLGQTKQVHKQRRKRKPNSANRYRSKIRKLGYSEKQIYQILLNHKHQHAHKAPKKHRRQKINHNKKKYALNQIILISKHKSDLSVSAIARKYTISRVTLYRWLHQWKKNPNRAYYSNLFKK